jgi:hypothetical protein
LLKRQAQKKMQDRITTMMGIKTKKMSPTLALAVPDELLNVLDVGPDVLDPVF